MTLSFVLLVYTGESVTTTFLITVGMFGGMAVYGTTTRRSLAGFGQFLFMGVIGIVLASVVGLFWHSDGLQFVISVIGVIVFTGLAAYDAQRLRSMALTLRPARPGHTPSWAPWFSISTLSTCFCSCCGSWGTVASETGSNGGLSDRQCTTSPPTRSSTGSR